MHAVHTLRREGFDGPITVIGEEHHEPYDRPPLSKQFLAGEWDSERIVLPAAREDLDLEWRSGCRARALSVADRLLTLDDGEELPFDGLVVATGAAPRRLPGTEELDGVHVLRTLDDALALRTVLGQSPRVTIVGAGFIGAEVAATCRSQGAEVTMVEALPAPLERGLGREMGMVVADLHRQHGVDVRLGVGVTGLEGGGRVESVRLADGSSIETDVLVVGIGVGPVTGWLEGSGLVLDDGVVCDDTCLAGPGITAAGDVARWPSRRYGRTLRLEHWENAVQQGEAAARRLLAGSDREAEVYDPVPWFWSDQYDRKIQLAGVAAPHDRVEVVVGDPAELRFVALYGHEGRTIGVLGMNRPRHVMQLRPHVADGTPFDEAVTAARAL